MDVPDEPNKGWRWNSLGVPSVITDALIEQKFYEPTEIQALALPPAIFGRRDILGAAETGSGKTLAFGIPLLNGILNLKKKEGKPVNSTSGVFKEYNIDDGHESDEDCDMSDQESISEETIDSTQQKNGIGLVRVINNYKFEDDSEISKPIKPLYALILTPTRELAIQIKDHLTKAARFTDIKVYILILTYIFK